MCEFALSTMLRKRRRKCIPQKRPNYDYIGQAIELINAQLHPTNLIISTQSTTDLSKLDKIQFTQGLPKTRSGKIMRRILRKIAHKDTSNLGDTSTLLNPEVVQDIMDNAL